MRARDLIAAIVALASIFTVDRLHALERGAFGWRAAEVVGERPLLAIWIRDTDNLPSSELAKYTRYFEDTLFRGAVDGSGTEQRFEATSLPQYFREVSRGKFTFSRGGLIGPLTLNFRGKSADEVARMAIDAAAEQVDFRAFDRDRNHHVGPQELSVLVITNARVRGTPGHDEHAIPGQDMVFSARIAMAAEDDALEPVARALFRTLVPEAIDLDGWPQKCFALNRGLTLMAAANTAIPANTIHLDPWHKMLAGWVEPRLVAMGKPGKARMAAQHFARSEQADLTRPVLLYDGAKGTSEFFLLEYRTRSALGFDRDLATSGLVIWQVGLDPANHVITAPADRANCKGETLPVSQLAVRGAPDWQFGKSQAYVAANGPVALKWIDGSDVGVQVSTGEFRSIDWAIDVSWTAPRK